MAAGMVHSPTVCGVPANSCGSTGKMGPFRATQLWNEIILHLRSHVERKRRRVKMKTYEGCFMGTDAVDVVLHHLLDDNINFHRDISREKAVKLCQLLMESGVFEPVGGGQHGEEEKKDVFKDSQKCYYKFIEEYNQENELSIDSADTPRKDTKLRINRQLEPDLLDDDDVISNPIVLNKKGQIVQELINITRRDTMRRRSRDFIRKTLSPITLFNKRPSDSLQDLSPTPCKVPQEAADEIWKEVALSKLLTLVDLPFIDGLLTQNACTQKSSKHNLVISNNNLDNHDSALSFFSNSCDDAWVDTAYDCLEFIPKGLSLAGETPPDFPPSSQDKIRLYTIISNYYSSRTEPLLSSTNQDLHTGILNLLMQRKLDIALEAVQLSFVLLPRQLREEVQSLLRFMYAVAHDKDVHLSNKESNSKIVETVFTDHIIKNKLLAHNQAAHLVLFMMKNYCKLNDVPEDITESVHLRLEKLKQGKLDPIMEIAYCDMVTDEEYKQQATTTTEIALKDLMNSILDNTSILLKEKKERLKQFKKYHQEIYDKYFSDLH